MAVLAATSLALVCSHPVLAQQDGDGTWSFSNSFHSQTNKINGVDQPPQADASLDSVNNSSSGSPGFAYASFPPTKPDGSVGANVMLQGRDHVTAYWTPPSNINYGPPAATPTPIPPPPATVTVLVNATVTASLSDNSVSDLAPAASVDDGFGDPAVVISSDSTHKNWQSSGLHLKTFSTASHTWIPPVTSPGPWGSTTPGRWKIDLPLDLDLSASITASGTGFHPYYWNPGDVTARLGNLSFLVDSRSVILSRAGAIGETAAIDGSGQWTTYGDTLRSTLYAYGYLQSTNYQGITASPTGLWALNSQATWSPTGTGTFGSLDSLTYSEQGMPVTGNEYPVTYTIKDAADQAIANAKYVLRLHDPYEILTHNPATQLAVNPMNLTPVYDGGLLGFTGTYTQGVTYNVHLKSSFSGETEKYLGAKLGLNLEGSWDKTWTDSTTININVPAGKLGWLEQRDLYNVHTGTANSWNDKGFTGLVSYTLTEIPAGGDNSHIKVGWVYQNAPPPSVIPKNIGG